MSILRKYMNIIESWDEDEFENAPRSYGWWVYPDGVVEECPEMGTHLDLAYSMIGGDIDPNDAIDEMKLRGGVRVSTFHGSDAMGIDFNPNTITPQAKTGLLKLLRDERQFYTEYYFDIMGQTIPHQIDFREAIKLIRG